MHATPPGACRLCDTVRDPGSASSLAWVREARDDVRASGTGTGTATWLCPRCARRHVRDIEAKLPHEYW